MIFSSVKTITDAERVLNRAGHPAGAILVDALHLQRSGGTPADVGAVAPEQLPYVQLCDGPFQPILPDSAVALTEARTGRLFRAMVNCRWLSFSARCPPGVAGDRGAGCRPGRKGDRGRGPATHAALIGLLAKADPSADQADWGNGTLSAVD